MTRYGEAFRNRTVARSLPPESANVGAVAKEIGVSVQTLERWRERAPSRPARGRAWTAGARLEAVITAAALDEAGKSAWCREHGVYPAFHPFAQEFLRGQIRQWVHPVFLLADAIGHQIHQGEYGMVFVRAKAIEALVHEGQQRRVVN